MLNKKASLELSIRTIVIVILAMTLLGLGLGFIRNMFSDIGGLSEDVTEQIRQQVLNDLITNDKKVSFPKTEIKIGKGDAEILVVGIRNKEDEILSYKMSFTSQSAPEGAEVNAPLSWLQYNQNVHQLSSSDSDVRNIRLNIPRDAKAGSYFLTFDVKKDPTNEIYAQKDLFIVVRD
jgi:hypothetical protein